MAQNKTQPTQVTVDEFLATVDQPQKVADSRVLIELMERISGAKATMWGPSIIGFGTYHYKYDSGREGDFLEIGFSPRKAAISIYLMAGHARYPELMAKLGKHKTGKGCLYVKKLSDIDMDVLEQLVTGSVQYIRAKYPS